MTSPASSQATFIFVDLPPQTLLGIDLLSFNSSPNFHGVRNIPAGFHFLYSGTDASLAIRHGFWLNLSGAAQVLVWQWNASEERLYPLKYESAVVRTGGGGSSLPQLQDARLVDYHALLDATSDAQTKQDDAVASDVDDWPQLTSHITRSLLSRVLPTCPDVDGYSISSVSTAPADSEAIPGLSGPEAASAFTDLHETPLGLLPIDLKKTWREGAVGRERTDAARDRTWYLQHLMDSIGSGRRRGAGELLGELQLTFLMVLTLANYSCLEGWKRLLNVLLTCNVALGETEQYFVEVVKVLRTQIGHCEDVEGGLFEFREEGSGAWLKQLLRGFKRNLEEVLGGKGPLAEEVSELEDLMRERYGWEVDAAMLRRGIVELEDGERLEISMEGADFEEEMGEYAPAYVEVD